MFDLHARTLLLVVGGSRAYGIHTSASDVDVKGCCVPPAASLHGFLHPFAQVDDRAEIAVFRSTLTPEERDAADREGLEGTVFDVRKLLALAAQANPNILDVLFCRDDEVRVAHPLGQRLRDQRDLFVSGKARQTFSGYATAQLKRIKNHRAWLLAPPKGQPTRADFDLPEAPLVPRDQLLAAEAAVQKQIDRWELDLEPLEESDRIKVRAGLEEMLTQLGASLGLGSEDAQWLGAARWVGLDDDLIEVLKRERSYRTAQTAWRAYEQWRTNRNPARAALEARHGYDTKHGAHLVRLLRMGREVLQTGEVHVWRGPGGPDDAAELLEIRRGAWDYDRLVAWADHEHAELDRIVAEGRSVVPDAPDREAIDQLCVEVVEAALRDLG